MSIDRVKALIRDVPDFPKPGIVFKDITPLLADAEGFKATIDWMLSALGHSMPDGILAIESRGFIFGAALAHAAGLPLQLVRKRGKLPREVVAEEYALEYGVDHLEMHEDAVQAGHSYVLIDDVLATGGTAAAVARLVDRRQARLSGCLFLMELGFLDGRQQLGDAPVEALIRY